MKMVTQIKVQLIITTIAAIMAIPVSAGDKGKSKEEKVKLSDCPAAVQKTIKDNANGGEILEVEKETNKDGAVVYEAEVKKAGGKKVETVTEDGKLLGVEDEDEEDDEDEDDDDEKDDDDKA